MVAPAPNAGLFAALGRGSISNYEPSWRDNVAYWLARNWYGDNREGVQKANRLLNVADVTPAGIPFALDDAARSLNRGDYVGGGVTLAMAGIPAVRKEAKLTGEAAKEVLGNILEKHGLAPKTIRAYHGSPHSFDKFDMSKIGTGEGAQAYGHGLYFAENEATAKAYKEKLSPGRGADAKDIAARVLAAFNGDRASAIGEMQDRIASLERRRVSAPETVPDNQLSGRTSMHDALDVLQSEAPLGSMYEVQINADPEQFLDWDKPLSEQPESVRKSLEDVYPDLKGNTAQQAFPYGIRPQISEALNKGGIPGIKYLDQGSRAKGDGSRNYVVFDDRLITILRKYGLLPPIAGAAAYGAAQDQQTAY